MADKVNERLPEEQRFELLGWHFEKTQRLNREYRRLYPDGRLIWRIRVLWTISFVCLLISVWGLRHFVW